MIRHAVLNSDGVLTPFRSSWRYLHELLGTSRIAGLHRRAAATGLIEYDEWAFIDVMLWHGVPSRWTRPRVVLRDGAIRLLKLLRENGVKIIVLSGGLDYVRDVIEDYVDAFISNEIVYRDGLVYSVNALVRSKECYVNVLEQRMGVRWDETLAIGDDVIDVPVLMRARYSIAYNPVSSTLTKVSRFTVYSRSLHPVVLLVDRLLKRFNLQQSSA